MRRFGLWGASALALWSVAGGCGLLDSAGLHFAYSFDPQEFKQSLGDETHPQTLPTVACTPGESPDPCAAAQSQLPTGSGMVTCDATKKECVASAEVRLPQEIDLRNAMTSLPSEAVQFSVSSVAIDKITYWVTTNTLNVPTPPVDIYVAPDAAKSETDPGAVKLGSVAALPAKSTNCADKQDAKGESGVATKVCDLPLTDAGQRALGEFVKNFKTTPFKIIVHAVVTATGGTPVPAGALDLFVRPSVTLSILK
jgi:hypothetical protein